MGEPVLDLGLPQATGVCSARVLRLGSFQGESQLYCYEVNPQQPALSPGRPCPCPSLPLASLFPLPLLPPPPILTLLPWCPQQ